MCVREPACRAWTHSADAAAGCQLRSAAGASSPAAGVTAGTSGEVLVGAVARGVFVPRAGPPPYNHTCRLLKARWHTAPACAEHGKWPLKRSRHTAYTAERCAVRRRQRPQSRSRGSPSSQPDTYKLRILRAELLTSPG